MTDALPRLSPETLASVPADTRFTHDRAQTSLGIIHFGIGAFHRAHQAWYTDRAMDAGDTRWGICGVSLRSASVAEQLMPQGGLYTVAERGAGAPRLRVVGAVHEVLVGPDDRAAILERLASPDTHIASFTVTEKGYCRKADGNLDLERADKGSIYGFLGEGLARRRAQGLPGLTLLSCDNLADNGRTLERLLGQWCAHHDPELGAWIAQTCTFPGTMVDRIVPATTDADRAAVAQQLGLADEACVVTEAFSQWVIEDRFAGPRPAWEDVGAQIVAEVTPYEAAKLRMLNGAHSALAYIGLAAGHTFVHEAVADPAIRPRIEDLMRKEAAPTLTPAPGQDLDAYAKALLARFENPALAHRLAQIAMDGSQKIPQRWLETLEANHEAGRSCPAILAALKAWFCHLRGANGPLEDPMADELTALARAHEDDELARRLFAPEGLLGGIWNADPAEIFGG
ncbi:mannitol dehydrogenase family protein [Novosphingobium profundi]|uniref:mannitol dehydrogenase family protein n=1 Tax=Novosphingobium profundi TaxID=1774954 RepID=UPI001CFEEA7D|nr:mannitol dehydrogenase family protein [Novosphingobium profundi]